MPTDPTLLFTFALMAVAVLLLWAPPIHGRRDWTWCSGLVLVCLGGLTMGAMDWRAPVCVAVYAALAWRAREAQGPRLRVPLLVLTGLCAFVLALHRVPGFFNPVVAEGILFSRGAAPVGLRLNLDTAVAGIVLMGVFCQPARSAADWRAMLKGLVQVLPATLLVVLTIGWGLGYVRPDLKWTGYSAWFLVSNLLFTCVTEEAFFRGFLLAGFARLFGRRRFGERIALVLSAVLFGLAHARGGAPLVLMATVAGLFYGDAYLRTRRIEAAILTHFALNAVHFLAFTYPALTS